MQFLTALAVLAQEEGESGGLSLVLPHTKELIAGIVAFAIVFFFVWRKALPAINRILEARQQAISGQLDDAEKAKTEAENLLADYRAQLAEAKSEGNRIIEEARTAAEQLKTDMVARAEAEAAQILAKAREEAENEKARALAEARHEVGESRSTSPRRSSASPRRQDAAGARRALPGGAGAALDGRSDQRLRQRDPRRCQGRGRTERVENEFLALAQPSRRPLSSGRHSPTPASHREEEGIVDDLIGGRASPLTVGLVLRRRQGDVRHPRDSHGFVAGRPLPAKVWPRSVRPCRSRPRPSSVWRLPGQGHRQEGRGEGRSRVGYRWRRRSCRRRRDRWHRGPPRCLREAILSLEESYGRADHHADEITAASRRTSRLAPRSSRRRSGTSSIADGVARVKGCPMPCPLSYSSSPAGCSVWPSTSTRGHRRSAHG